MIRKSGHRNPSEGHLRQTWGAQRGRNSGKAAWRRGVAWIGCCGGQGIPGREGPVRIKGSNQECQNSPHASNSEHLSEGTWLESLGSCHVASVLRCQGHVLQRQQTMAPPDGRRSRGEVQLPSVSGSLGCGGSTTAHLQLFGLFLRCLFPFRAPLFGTWPGNSKQYEALQGWVLRQLGKQSDLKNSLSFPFIKGRHILCPRLASGVWDSLPHHSLPLTAHSLPHHHSGPQMPSLAPHWLSTSQESWMSARPWSPRLQGDQWFRSFGLALAASHHLQHFSLGIQQRSPKDWLAELSELESGLGCWFLLYIEEIFLQEQWGKGNFHTQK